MVDIARGQFHRHRRIDKLVLVLHPAEFTISAVHVDYWGLRMPRARRSVSIPLARFVKDFELYRSCRWALDCHAQAIGTIHHQDHGDIDVCAEHGAEHAEWRTRCAELHPVRWPDEPDPDCECPDSVGGRMVVDYCPTHGTPQRRGHNFGDDLSVNLAVFAQAGSGGGAA